MLYKYYLYYNMVLDCYILYICIYMYLYTLYTYITHM